MVEGVLVTAGEDFKVWETASYAEVYKYAPEVEGGKKAEILCTSWSTDTTGLASCIKNENKIVLTFNKSSKYTSHEIITQGILKPNFVQFPRTSQKHLYLSSGNELHYFDLSRHKSRKSFTLTSQISCFVPNQTDSYLAIGCNNGALVLLTTASNQLSQPLTAPKCAGQRITCVKYCMKRPAFLGCSSESGTVSFWDCNANKNIFNINEHLAPCTSFAFSPVNDTLAASCGLDKKFICHDTKSRRSVSNLVLEQPCTAVDFDVDGTTVAIGTSRGKVFIYDLRNTTTAWRSFQAHNGKVGTLAFKPTIDKGNVNQVMSAVKSTSKSKLRSQKSISALKTVQEESKENVKPEESDIFQELTEKEGTSSPGVSDTSVFSKRDSLSSQLFSPLKDTEFSFTGHTPNPSSKNSSRRGSEVRLSTEGLFSPVREDSGSLNLGRRTPLSNLGTPAASPLTSIQEESTSPPLSLKSSTNTFQERRGGKDLKLSLDTLTEVAKSLTARGEGSPEYDDKISHSLPPPDMPEPVLDLYKETTQMTRPVLEPERLLNLNDTEAEHRLFEAVREKPVTSTARKPVCSTARGTADVEEMREGRPEELFQPTGLDRKVVSSEDRRGRADSGQALRTGQDLKSILTAFPAVLLDDISPEHHRRVGGGAVPSSNGFPRPRAPRHQGSAGESSGSTGGQVDEFNRRYVEEVVTEAMEEWCTGVENRIINMHYSMIRIMQQHQEETKMYIEELHGMDALRRENERLKLENHNLRQFF